MLEVITLSLLAGGAGLLAVNIRKRIGWQHQLEQQEEEEILTRYESKENQVPPESLLQNGADTASHKDWRQLGWEFKIVRANRDLFQNSAIFNRVCAEEAEAGWILLEKLDERRLRFKRPMALRELIKPETLNRDPYRCYYRASNLKAWLRIIALLIAIVLPAYLGYTFVSTILTQTRDNSRRSVFPAPSPPSPTLPPLQ
jgi:hypothetical protein